jgi:hypothetical protein
MRLVVTICAGENTNGCLMVGFKGFGVVEIKIFNVRGKREGEVNREL